MKCKCRKDSVTKKFRLNELRWTENMNYEENSAKMKFCEILVN